MNGRIRNGLLAMVVLGSATMFGSTVTVTVLNTGGTPFSGLLDGSPVLYVCDDNKDTVVDNETWQATKTSLASVINDIDSPNNGVVPNTYFGNVIVGGQHVGTTLYEEVAWLIWQFGPYAGNSSVVSAIQTAIWDIMDQQSETDSGITSAGYWISLAMAQINPSTGKYNTTGPNRGLNSTQIADTLILTPVGYAYAGLGGPQEFFTTTPEPATFALFGAGLILLSVGTFRRRRAKKNN